MFGRTFLLGSLALVIAASLALSSERAANVSRAERVHSIHLHNLYRVSDDLFSGGSPESEDAFAEIARLGVTTILSVDGMPPNLDAARKHGLSYVHLPIGYDGIRSNRVTELAALALKSGKIYVHCHHGLHRGPAAVAIMSQASGQWSKDEALTWLKQAGTSKDYGGLYRSVREFRLPAPDTVAKISNLPESTAPSPLVEAMAAIDAEFVRLKKALNSKWSAAPDAARTAVESATLISEQFTELHRSSDRNEEFLRLLRESATTAAELKMGLGAEKIDADLVGQSFRMLAQRCASCHRQYRDGGP